MDIELFKTIGRLRRSMPRNTDVMALCDELERRFLPTDPPKRVKEKATEHSEDKPLDCPECERRRQQTLARVRRARAKK